MFLGHSANWWAIVISVAFFLLTFPLSVLANWVTPSLKNWYAERSVAATQARIAQIEKELQEPELTDFEDHALMGIQVTLVMTSLGVLLLSVLVLNSARDSWLLAVASLGMTVLVFSAVLRTIRRFHQVRSPRLRFHQRKDVERLKARVS